MAAEERTVVMTNGATLRSFLDQLFEQGIKSTLAQRALTEKEKQAKVGSNAGGGDNSGGGVDDLFGGSSTGADGDEQQDAPPSKTMDDESDKLKKGDIEPKDIIDKLNSIRSGKSFKDSAVSKAMDDYLSSLSKAERVALLAFCRGIAQIVTGVVPGQQADEPSEKPADVKMQKGPGPAHTKHIQPNVIRAPGRSNEPARHGNGAEEQEDTTAPVSAPITPKKR
jgi:hypothetical protein